ncbi:MAG: hypothetical protein K2X93_16990 [Candidatus Obscuribacterales bacterium]|nr:hypothetical protein [Candidatus Obscuribacterales bacterium]
MRAFARVLLPLALLLAAQSDTSARNSESDIPASFKGLTREQQTACIELDALNRTHNVESLVERLWRLEQKALRTPNTTSKPVKDRINALAVELPPSEEIIEEVRTRMSKPGHGKLPPDLFRDKSGIHEVDAAASTTNSGTSARRTSPSTLGGYGALADDLGKLEATLAKLKKMAQGDSSEGGADDSSLTANPPGSSSAYPQNEGRGATDDGTGVPESKRDSMSDGTSDDSMSSAPNDTAGGWPAEYSRPGETEAKSADKLPDVAFADLQPSQQLAALEIEHHDRLGDGKSESRLRQLEVEIMGADYAAVGKSEKERLKVLNASSPASNLSIKRAIKALKSR